MTDQLSDQGAEAPDIDLDLAADADVMIDAGDEPTPEPTADAGAPAPAAAPTIEERRQKFAQTKNIEDLDPVDQAFFRDYKKAFNKEMDKARRMVKEAAETRERYEAFMAQGKQPGQPPEGPPDLGPDIDPAYKAAFDARVAYQVEKTLEKLGLPKRVETAEQRAATLEHNNWVNSVMTELKTVHGMTGDEERALERMMADDPSIGALFSTQGGRAKLIRLARLDLQEAQQQVTQVQRQAESARAGVSRPTGGGATPTPTDYRKIREEQGMDAVRDTIVEETLREMGGKAPSWP